MTRCATLASILLYLVVSATPGGDQVNPLKTAKVGDWVQYKSTTKTGSKAFEGETKQQVIARDDKTVTLKTTVLSKGKELLSHEKKVDLTKPFEGFLALPTKDNPNAKAEKVGEGKETIKIGDRTYLCTWTKMRATIEVGDKQFLSDVKMWIAATVPLEGLVKMEMKSDTTQAVMELSGMGRGK